MITKPAAEHKKKLRALLKKAFDAGYDYRNQETEDGSPFRGKEDFSQWFKKLKL